MAQKRTATSLLTTPTLGINLSNLPNLTKSSRPISAQAPSTYIGYDDYNACLVPLYGRDITRPFTIDIDNAITTYKNPNASGRRTARKIIEEYLVEQRRCSMAFPAITNNWRLHLFQLNSTTLGNLLNSPLSVDASFQANIACAIDSLLNSKPNDHLLSQERLHYWFKKMKLFGTPSAEGYAADTSFTNNTSFFVVKTPRKLTNDSLAHEAAIGMYAMNNLRKILPNYMYVYTYTKCSPMAVETTQRINNIITWCDTDNPRVTTSYLISENIINSRPFNDFLLRSYNYWWYVSLVYYYN